MNYAGNSTITSVLSNLENLVARWPSAGFCEQRGTRNRKYWIPTRDGTHKMIGTTLIVSLFDEAQAVSVGEIT